MIDTKGTYIFLEHLTQNPILKVNYTFIQLDENEHEIDILEDIIDAVNCDYTYESLTLYRKPLKGTTVADLYDSVPSIVLTGKLRNMHEFKKDIVDGVVNPRDYLYNPEKIYKLLESPFKSPFTTLNESCSDSCYHSESDKESDQEYDADTESKPDSIS